MIVSTFMHNGVAYAARSYLDEVVRNYFEDAGNVFDDPALVDGSEEELQEAARSYLFLVPAIMAGDKVVDETYPDDPKEGDLRVWWVPQIPGKAFYVPVSSIAEGRRLETILADYDLFQLHNNIKPDYCNAGGMSRYEEDPDNVSGTGFDWFDIDDDEEDLPN